MPRTRTKKPLLRSQLKKSLCIVDTCSLVYLNNVELAKKPLQKWLWEEFDIRYSEAISNEFTTFEEKMSFHEEWEKHIWKFPNISNYESAIFSSHQKKVVGWYCSRCKQTTWKYEMFTPNLEEAKDRGERHNCCLALHAILEGHYSQIIFLTDDLRAVRDYTAYFFDLFPLGSVWSLLDFITYLFVRNRKEISLEDTKNALRDVNTAYKEVAGTKNEEQQDADTRYQVSEKQLRRLVPYYQKVNRISQIFSRI